MLIFPFTSVVAFAAQAHAENVAYKEMANVYRANGFKPPPRPVYAPVRIETERQKSGFGWTSLILAYLVGAGS
jgi:hypothetical protein